MVGQPPLNESQERRGLPNEHPRIPPRRSLAEEPLRDSSRWLLHELSQPKDPASVSGAQQGSCAEMAESRMDSRRSYANRHDSLIGVCPLDRGKETSLERRNLSDPVVGWQDRHHLRRIALGKRRSGQRNTGSGVFPFRLDQERSATSGWERIPDSLSLLGGRDDEERVVPAHQRLDSRERSSEERVRAVNGYAHLGDR